MPVKKLPVLVSQVCPDCPSSDENFFGADVLLQLCAPELKSSSWLSSSSESSSFLTVGSAQRSRDPWSELRGRGDHSATLSKACVFHSQKSEGKLFELFALERYHRLCNYFSLEQVSGKGPIPHPKDPWPYLAVLWIAEKFRFFLYDFPDSRLRFTLA